MNKSTAVEMAKTTIRLPKDLLQSIRIQSIHEERDMQDIIAEALQTYMKTAAKRKGVKS